MTRRVLLGFLTVTVLVLAFLEIPLGVFYARRELERFTADVERDASIITTIYEDDLEASSPLDPRPAKEYATRTGARVVVTDADGIARVDTEQSVPRDFSTRPEIATAMQGERSVGKRRSETLSTELVFVAMPVASGGTVHGTLRVTVGTADVDARVRRYWLGLGAIATVVLAVMAIIGWAIARSVTRPVRRLTETAERFARGDLAVGGAGRKDEMADAPVELRTLAATMEHMAERLAVLLAEQRAFVADASHQLRTPLTALRLGLENLQARLPGDAAAELDAPIQETERLADLVTDLLRLARADEVRSPVVVDLAPIVNQRADTWSAVADTFDVHLRVEGTGEPVMVRAVPGAIEQILDNLLDNAMQAAPSRSTVTIAVDLGARCHRLSVNDEGPGLDDEDKEKAVRRFWRGGHATPGTGLGLAIADALARASGGQLRLADAPGRGLSVIVELPADPAADRLRLSAASAVNR